MPAGDSTLQSGITIGSPLVELAEVALTALSPEELLEFALLAVAGTTQATSVFLYVVDSQLATPHFLHHWLQPDVVPARRRLSADLCTDDGTTDRLAAFPRVRLRRRGRASPARFGRPGDRLCHPQRQGVRIRRGHLQRAAPGTKIVPWLREAAWFLDAVCQVS